MTNKELDSYVLDYIEGNKDAFDVIYQETKKNVYLSIYTIIKNQTTIEDLMQDRTNCSSFKTPTEKFLPVEGLENEALCAFPIICAGDVIGSVCVLKTSKTNLTDAEKAAKINLAEITTQLLGKQLED